MSDFDNLMKDFLNEDNKRKVVQPAGSASGSGKNYQEAYDKARERIAAKTGNAPIPFPVSNFVISNDQIMVSYYPSKNAEAVTLKIPKFNLTPKTLKNKSVIFYGLSGSGKTTLVNHIMYIMKDEFPIVMIFNPTNSQNHAYDGTVPDALIYENFDIKIIKEFYNRQKMAAHARNVADDIKILHGIYQRVASFKSADYFKRMQAEHQKYMDDVERSTTSPSEKKAKRNKVMQEYHDRLRSFYYRVIDDHIERLTTMPLDKEEIMAIKYRHFNPAALAVYDDTNTEIKQLITEGKRAGDDVISDFFFKGRHAKITHFYTFQDDGKLDSGIRKNAFVSIFTSKPVALAYFNRTANNFTKEEKAEAVAIIEAVFTPTNKDGSTNHKKLVYSREMVDKFSFIIAEEHDQFQMCSAPVWEYCNSVGNNNRGSDKSNPYYRKFL